MVKIIESQNRFGTMNEKSVRLSNITEEDKELLCFMHHMELKDLKTYDLTKDKKLIFRVHRKNLGQYFGFDGNHMFMADQKKHDGSFFEVTSNYVKAHPYGWTDIPEDILIVTSETPNVVIGHPVADCPVVMMCDKKQKVSAIGHCSGEFIDQQLPYMIAEVLQKEYGSNAKDIFAYVSASAGPNWFYDSYPKWAKDSSIWKNCITYDHENKQFHINIKPAVLMQIIHSGVLPKNIQFNMDDTITHPAYYSNHASSKKGGNQPEKNGRHFAGLYYDEEDSAKVKILKPRKR